MDIESILVPNITLHETIDRLATKKMIIHLIHFIAKNKRKTIQNRSIWIYTQYAVSL
jgi:hypothetical protein